MRKYSSKVVDGKDRSPSRSMLRAVGFTDNDFKLPQIGVAWIQLLKGRPESTQSLYVGICLL